MKQIIIKKHVGKNTIESDIKELKKSNLDPLRRKELQDKVDFFNHGMKLK